MKKYIVAGGIALAVVIAGAAVLGSPIGSKMRNSWAGDSFQENLTSQKMPWNVSYSWSDNTILVSIDDTRSTQEMIPDLQNKLFVRVLNMSLARITCGNRYTQEAMDRGATIEYRLYAAGNDASLITLKYKAENCKL